MTTEEVEQEFRDSEHFYDGPYLSAEEERLAAWAESTGPPDPGEWE